MPLDVEKHSDEVWKLAPRLSFLAHLFSFKPQRVAQAEGSSPLTAAALKEVLVKLILERALTTEAYEADRDNWQPMSLEKWRQMYLNSYCKFSFSDRRVSLTLFMRHWEHIVNQSIMFDQNNFLNDLNGTITGFGWYVESLSPPDQNVTVTFHVFNGKTIIRNPPRHLYYFAGAWNKKEILERGILPCTTVDRASGRRLAEYDVLMNAFNLAQIREITDKMYQASMEDGDAKDVSYNILRIIGYMPIIVLKVNTSNISANVWSRKEPVYDEDKETGLFISYTYIPPAALEAIVHEDEIPNLFGTD